MINADVAADSDTPPNVRIISLVRITSSSGAGDAMVSISEGGPGRLETRQRREDVSDAIASMTAADKAKLDIAAKFFSRRSGIPLEDLVQEAVVGALETRTCALGVPLIAYLCGIMRSLASEPARVRKRARESNGLEVVYAGTYGDEGLPEPLAEGPSPEDIALSRTFVARRLAQFLDELDQALRDLVEAEEAGYRGRELEQILGLDTRGLAALKKRLGRTARAAAAAMDLQADRR